MTELKTKVTHQNPADFLQTIEPEQKRKDAFVLLELFERVTGEKPVMWGPSIIGYGTYHYKSEKSNQEADWMVVGFSPRKQNLTLYIMHGIAEHPALKKLGKYKTSAGAMGGCLYITKLSDVDLEVLADLIKTSFHSKRMYAV